MSYTEHYKGTMKKIYKEMPLEDQLNAELKKWNIEMTYQIEYDEFGDNTEEIMEALQEEDNYFLYKDNLYLVGKNELNPYDDIMSAHKIDDDTIGFEVKYYNGGCDYCVFDTDIQLCHQINKTHPCGHGHYVLVNANIKERK